MTYKDETIDVTNEANLVWSTANALRGPYMEEEYPKVIIPMAIIRRFECCLEPTKDAVVKRAEEMPNYPDRSFKKMSHYPFYNTSRFTLNELLNSPNTLAKDFKEYIDSFSDNVKDILTQLEIKNHIDRMDESGCLFSVVQKFANLDLSPSTYDSIKMGYIFENLIGRKFQNAGAGDHYTGRDIIRLLVEILMSEGCNNLHEDGKVIKICDQACGTGGMLTTAYSYITENINPNVNILLYGQEFANDSYAIGKAEMLIKNQDAENFRLADTLKKDCFPDIKMNFVIMNPPFGTPWSGDNAKEGQADAVRKEYEKGFAGRWGAGLPSGSDSQLLFIQSGINKLEDDGRGAFISNGSPLFTGGTASGESQIRKWLLENDLIEAIIQFPAEMFYNTGITTYVWIISKNKREERKGKIQLIDASSICHKLRKSLGHKRYEFFASDREKIVKLYKEFKDNKYVKIFNNTEFLYREYAVMQPLQRSYSITEKSIEDMLASGSLSALYDESKIAELEQKGSKISEKDKKKLDTFKNNKTLYDSIIRGLEINISNKKYNSKDEFEKVIEKTLGTIAGADKYFAKIIDGLSVMDKEAEVQTVKSGKNKGEIIYDKTTKDIELVKFDENIDDYMTREVLPHVPDAKWFWEENLTAKKPVIKTGAEIPFTRYFYKYEKPESSEILKSRFTEMEKFTAEKISELFED